MVNEHEFFMPFTEFPWFLKATIEQIYNVEFFYGKHLHACPKKLERAETGSVLDIDIDLESLKHPELYPLKYSYDSLTARKKL